MNQFEYNQPIRKLPLVPLDEPDICVKADFARTRPFLSCVLEDKITFFEGVLRLAKSESSKLIGQGCEESALVLVFHVLRESARSFFIVCEVKNVLEQLAREVE